MGRLKESIAAISRAVELDPVSQAILKDKGLALYYDRQYDEAIAVAKQTLELDPNYAAAHRLLSLAYHGKAMFDAAFAENENWGALTNNEVEILLARAMFYAGSGRADEARSLIDGIEHDKPMIDQLYRGLALVYTALGDADIAFNYLESSFERREESILTLKVDPKFDPLHPDTRFHELLEKIGVA